MKKFGLVAIAVAMVVGMVSCASNANKAQEAINSSFRKVYTSYRDVLDLTDAATYTVKSGDTLTAITRGQYGDGTGYYFPLIMLASNEEVLDPDLIQPGMELTVPDFNRNIKNPAIATALKPYFKDIANVYKQKGTETAKVTQENLLAIADELGTVTAADVAEAVEAAAEAAAEAE